MRDAMQTDHRPVGCRTCGDYKKVQVGVAVTDCPECATWTAEHRVEMLKGAIRDRGEKPSIRMSDLSDEEKALVKEWRVLHPQAHELTLLTWVEGRRYDPAKDEEFLSEARREFKKWQFLRHTTEGITPGWVRHALETGDLSGLCAADKRHIEELRGKE